MNTKRILSIAMILVLLLSSLQFTAVSKAVYNVGDIIEYGNYPQSREKNASTLKKLDSVQKNWISFGYYKGSNSWYNGKMKPEDYTKYADIDLDGDGLRDYRAVLFNKYRQHYTGMDITDMYASSTQRDNNYLVDNIYYFKYEPVKWRVLDPESGLILSEKILDSQAFNNFVLRTEERKIDYWGDSDATIYANNYFQSSIRQWLNDDFYNTAFNASQAANLRADVLIETNGINSSFSKFASAACKDKVFLLSGEEVLNSKFGFSNDSNYDKAKCSAGTEYAKCQGLEVSTDNSNAGFSVWHLRTPGTDSADVICIGAGGYYYFSTQSYSTMHGIKPACRLSVIKSDTSKVPLYNVVGNGSEGMCKHRNLKIDNEISATCTQSGSTRGVYCLDCKTQIYNKNEIKAQHKDFNFDFVCDICGAENAVYFGQIIEYGMYPQREVKDSATINLLKRANKQWVSSGYYDSNLSQRDTSEFMKIADIDLDGDGNKDYRAVKIVNYKYDEYGQHWQEKNGYYENETYFFKYEPLRWKIVDAETGLMVTENIIDCKTYDSESTTYFLDGHKSKYYDSTIRSWLNNDFYNTAFNREQAENIRNDIEINNDCYEPDENPEYNSISSKDKIYLLSCDEVINEKAGFQIPDNEDDNRKAAGTDFAKNQGLLVFDAFGNYSSYYLRTPCGDLDEIMVAYANGKMSRDGSYRTNCGIRPACILRNIRNNSSAVPVSNNNGTGMEAKCMHKNQETVPGQEKTCTNDGFTSAVYCNDCSKWLVKSKTIKSGHTDSDIDGLCDICNNEMTYKTGDIILFGNYPQSYAGSYEVIQQLDAAVKEWVSYNFYAGTGKMDAGTMKPCDCMSYCDVDLDNDGLRDYRVVKIDGYRPVYTDDPPEQDFSYVSYPEVYNYYYFKFEPIKWRILDPESGLVVSDMALDCQAYNNFILRYGIVEEESSANNDAYWGNKEMEYYANDYFNSSIRSWLNNDFYNTAFNYEQAQNIRSDVLISNNYRDENEPQYNSQPTKDKMYLLSYDEAINSDYGFDGYNFISSSRKAKGSNYATSLGLLSFSNSVSWLLRSSSSPESAYFVISNGQIYSTQINNTAVGIRPACRLLKLKNDVSKTAVDNNIGSGTQKHDHSFTEKSKLSKYLCSNATCVRGSEYYYKCSGCTLRGSTTYEDGKALGHDYSITKAKKVNATCMAPGKEAVKQCSHCGNVKGGSEIPAKGHSCDTGTITKAATCTTTGIKTYKCTACGKVIETEVVNKTSHKLVAIPAVEATCTASGKTEGKKCSVCGMVTEEQSVIPKTGHKEVKLKSVSATVKKSGLTEGKKCSVCGKILTAQKMTLAQATDLKASTVKKDSIKLTWTKIAGAKYYKVEKYDSANKKWVAVKTVDTNSLTVSSLKAGTKYQFRVTALDSTKKISGKVSAVLKTGTLTSAPSVTLKSSKSKTAVASWKKVTGASKYTVYKSTDGKNWTKVTTTDKLTYTLSKLSGGKKIYVKVTAVNAYSKESAASAVKNVTVKK